jgi:hypothetical protein
LWHEADRVDDRERRRNDPVFERYQRNRHPYVNRPEWAALAFAPEITIAADKTMVRLTWPLEFADSRLESAPSANGPWEQATNIAVAAPEAWSVEVPRTSAVEFFRGFTR